MAIGMIMIYSVLSVPAITSSLREFVILTFRSWSFGLNGVPWILAAELFGGALRNFSGTYAALVQWYVLLHPPFYPISLLTFCIQGYPIRHH
jgi:hypothetical protein